MKRNLLVCLILLLSLNLVHAEDPKAAPEPSLKDVHYGPHERNLLDFWQADSATPAPVLVLIHGGGWLHGNKETQATQGRNLIKLMLANGISVAAINYRYSTIAPLPAPVYDAARAIQYLRANAKELNIDPAHIAATGGSAGGCTTLWLATHDDIADPTSDDPVARQSSRLCGAVANSAQTTIEPDAIREHVTPRALQHSMIHKAGGFGNNAEMEAGYEQVAALYHDFSPVNHITPDDPPILLTYAGRVEDEKEGIHHAKFGVYFKEQADKVGATCYIHLRHNLDLYPPAPSANDFFLHVLKGVPLNLPKNEKK